MSEPSLPHSEFEAQAVQARADLALALANLRDGLTPAHVFKRLAQDVRARAAPLAEPLMAHSKSAGGLLVLASVAGALAYGIGRQAATVGQVEPASAAGHDASLAGPGKTPISSTDPRATGKKRAGGYLKAVLISMAGLGTGALVAAKIPVSDSEKHLSGLAARDMKRWARDHSGELMAGAVNAFGVAKGVGGLLGLLALAASFGAANKKGN